MKLRNPFVRSEIIKFSFLSLKQLNNKFNLRYFDKPYKISFCAYNYVLSRSIITNKINNNISIHSSIDSFSNKLSYFFWRKYYLSKRIVRRNVMNIQSIGHNSFLKKGRLSSSKLIKLKKLRDSYYRYYNFYERSIMDINRLVYQGKRLFKKKYINRVVNKHKKNVSVDVAYIIQKNRSVSVKSVPRKLLYHIRRRNYIIRKITNRLTISTRNHSKLQIVSWLRNNRIISRRMLRRMYIFKNRYSINKKKIQIPLFSSQLFFFRRYKPFHYFRNTCLIIFSRLNNRYKHFYNDLTRYDVLRRVSNFNTCWNSIFLRLMNQCVTENTKTKIIKCSYTRLSGVNILSNTNNSLSRCSFPKFLMYRRKWNIKRNRKRNIKRNIKRNRKRNIKHNRKRNIKRNMKRNIKRNMKRNKRRKHLKVTYFYTRIRRHRRTLRKTTLRRRHLICYKLIRNIKSERALFGGYFRKIIKFTKLTRKFFSMSRRKRNAHWYKV